MNLGKAIKELRNFREMTQYQLMSAAKISQTSLSQIETGKKNPSTKTLVKISAALGVSPSLIYIMGIERTDVPAKKKLLYDALMPAIKGLVLQISKY